MVRLRLRLVVTTALALAAVLSAAGNGGAGLQVPSASAAPWHQGVPPRGIDVSRPTVSGTLVAKPITGEAPTARVICRDRDRTPDVKALMVNRGLVICTEEGNLVLLQLSSQTGIYNRDWRRLTVNDLTLGDHLNAWGVLRNAGRVLNPTFAVQDTSKPRQRLQMVSGRLVAMPIAGLGPTGQVICRDRDRTPDAQALVNRGLVICTEEGRLILLQLSPKTRILARDRTAAAVADFRLGDLLDAWGTLRDNGMVLNPTVTVEDTDIQLKATASQDFIANGGKILTLYVLKSDGGGPVQGLVYAQSQQDTQVILCSGRRGTWSDLRQGLTIDIRGSLFNRRTMTYVDTDVVRVVSCS